MNSIIQTALEQAEYSGLVYHSNRIEKQEVTDLDYMCWFHLDGSVPNCPHKRLERLIAIHNNMLDNYVDCQADAVLKVEKAIQQETARAHQIAAE